MSALTQRASGRAIGIVLIVGMVAAFLIVALRPAGAESPGGETYPDADAGHPELGVDEVCAYFLGTDYEGEWEEISVPRGGNNDRIFELQGYELGDRGATIDLDLVNNRKDLSFTITAGTVEGVALVDSNQGDSGQFFDYGASVTTETATYTDNGNVKSIVLCYTPEYEGILACGGTATETGADGDIASSAEVVRLDSGSDKQDCTGLLPYTLDITPTEVQYLFPPEYLGEDFLIRIDWAVSDAGADEILTFSTRQVDADDDGTYEDVEACATVTGLDPGEIPIIGTPATYPNVTHPTDTPVCLVAQVLNGTQTQFYSGQFDPAWK